MTQLVLDLLQRLQPSLDNFVPGRNGEALATLRTVAAGGGPQFVYLWGRTGSGRTHLLRSLTDTVDTAGASERVSGSEPGPAGEAGPAAVPDFTTGRLLYTLDDVDGLDADGQARLFVLLNEVRSHAGARFVGAGSAPPAQLLLREDVRTRLAWGLVHQLHALTDDEKAAALQAHADSRGVSVSPELIPWMLSHLPRDMRALVAALDAIDAYALAQRRALTVPLAREWLGRAGPQAGS
jgi:DnaA-homolog protein